MFRPTIDAILREFSAERCLDDIRRLWLCRSTVPGPGMYQASEQLCAGYRASGCTPVTHYEYPADDSTVYLDEHRLSLAWEPRSAVLRVVAPSEAAGVVCRYEDEPLCLVSNSVGTPPGGIEAEVVVHDGPLPAGEVREGQWAGKVLFTDQPPSMVAAAAHKAGIVGILSDCICPPWLVQHPPVREPADVPDLVMWSIFSGRRDQPPLFGFMLSPRQGRRLRQQVARGLRVHAEVDATLAPGVSDLVEAVLPGTDLADEEIWVLAHSSEPGARDNASGCAMSVELARVFTTLAARGELPAPRRTIRFLHAAEVTGFVPYLHARRDAWPRVVAGCCVDSVAQDYRRCGGEMVLFLSPEENASFVDGLMQVLFAHVAALPVQHPGEDSYVRYPWHTEPYFGNDAFIADGYFDIPTPQPSTWPDRYYHSNLDTPDMVGLDCLVRSAGAFGAFIHLVASAGPDEARWLGRLAAGDYRQRIAATLLAGAAEQTAPADLARRVRSLGLQGRDAVTQAARFAAADATLAADLNTLGHELAAFAAGEAQAGVAAAVGTAAEPEPAGATGGMTAVPKRLRWHLPGAAAWPEGVTPTEAVPPAQVWKWINGRRSVGAIVEHLAAAEGAAPADVEACLERLAQAGFVALVAQVASRA